jgi:hypothetical protein
MSDSVPVTTAPNVPMAEVLCGKLKEAGIPAYYADVLPIAGILGGSGVNPANPVEIFVRPEDIERARHVLA